MREQGSRSLKGLITYWSVDSGHEEVYPQMVAAGGWNRSGTARDAQRFLVVTAENQALPNPWK